MRKFITGSLELFCQIAIFLIITVMFVSGVAQGSIVGGLLSLIAGFVFSGLAFGGLFLLMDIADNTKRTVELLSRQDGA